MEQAEVPGMRGIHTVPNPVRLNEYHNVNDCETYGEYRPQHPNGPGVSHVVVMVNLGGFLRWQHFPQYYAGMILHCLVSISPYLPPSVCQNVPVVRGGVLLYIFKDDNNNTKKILLVMI